MANRMREKNIVQRSSASSIYVGRKTVIKIMILDYF